MSAGRHASGRSSWSLWRWPRALVAARSRRPPYRAGRRGRTRTSRAPSPPTARDRRAAHAAAAEGFGATNSRRQRHGRRLRHRRRLRALLRRRDRHLQRLAPDQGRGGRGLQEGRASTTASSRSRTTASRSSSTRATPGSRASRSRSSRRSGARNRRSAPGGISIPRSRTTRCALYGPGTDTGTFDFFTAQINGEEDVEPQRLLGQRGRQRHSSRASSGDRGALGYFGLSYCRGERLAAQAARGRRRRRLRQARARRRCRTAPTRRCRARSTSTSSTTRRSGPRCRRSSTTSSRTPVRSRPPRASCRSRSAQRAKALTALAKAVGE